MAHTMSKEELMRNSDPLVWELGGMEQVEKTERFCERLWVTLNGRFCNVMIVMITIIESLVVLSELLINLEFIQDPAWHPRYYNCSLNQSSLPAHHSVKLKAAKAVFCYLSLAILTLFLVEVSLRMVTGKFRFLMQGTEVLDAVIVITAFGLDMAFYVSPSEDKAKEASVLIILLRIWRIKRVIESLVNVERLKLNHIISEYQREKTISENKGEVLILRVEDLEHEVAYLKEKLKKTEKELQTLRKHRKRDSASSSSSSYRHPTVTIGVETNPQTLSSVQTQTGDEVCQVSFVPDELQTFASNLSQGVLLDALSLVSSDLCSEQKPLGLKDPPAARLASLVPGKQKQQQQRNPNATMGSAPTWQAPLSYISSLALDHSSRGGTEGNDSPESGYSSGGSVAVAGSAGRHTLSATVFLFPEPEAAGLRAPSCHHHTLMNDKQPHLVEMNVLDEASEIERIQRVEFDPGKCTKDIPMTSL